MKISIVSKQNWEEEQKLFMMHPAWAKDFSTFFKLYLF